MGSMRRRWLLLAVILTAPSGCDNVTWGGTEVRLQGPGEQARAPAPAPTAEEPATAPAEGMPTGPILLAGTRSGDTVTLVAVAEVQGARLVEIRGDTTAPDFLEKFIDARLAPGTDVVLFSEGARVGHMAVSDAHVDAGFCAPRAAVTGIVEVVPEAAQTRRFLALADGAASSRPYTPFRMHDDDYDQRVASLGFASDAIRELGAAWPPSVLEARADIQAFRLPERSGSGFAATFLYGDRLSVSAPGTSAYALFVMGTQDQAGYRAAFRWYRRAQDDGKGAPRYFDHLDWNGDGNSEILLDVFGADHRWFAALAQRNGAWVRSFQDSCGEAGR